MEAGLYSSNWVSARASRPACNLICQGRARPLAGCTRVASAYTWLHALCNSTTPFTPSRLPARSLTCAAGRRRLHWRPMERAERSLPHLPGHAAAGPAVCVHDLWRVSGFPVCTRPHAQHTMYTGCSCCSALSAACGGLKRPQLRHPPSNVAHPLALQVLGPNARPGRAWMVKLLPTTCPLQVPASISLQACCPPPTSHVTAPHTLLVLTARTVEDALDAFAKIAHGVHNSVRSTCMRANHNSESAV